MPAGRRRSPARQRLWRAAALACSVLAATWLLATDDVRVWPARNTLEYRLVMGWWRLVGALERRPAAASGAVAGVVRSPQGSPIAGARVLLAAWDGTAYAGLSGEDGRYVIARLPVGDYAAVAGAPGYADAVPARVQALRWPWQAGALRVPADAETRLDVVLRPAPAQVIDPGHSMVLDPAEVVASAGPLPGQATRRRLRFTSAGRLSQPAYYYLPVPGSGPADVRLGGTLPVLLAVYPGPAAEWDAASIPLAAAGFAVVAAGPAYSFELERDVDELARLIQLARQGALPGADAGRLALLGGSYSGLHVLQLLERGVPAAAAVLLGAPSDLFDMRRRLEAGTFIPPFGLDAALVALGFPDRAPLRYWRNSGAYHVRPGGPPVLILHSRSDDVVPWQQSERLARSFGEAGVIPEVHFYTGGSHYLLSDDDDALRIYEVTRSFLDRHLRAAPR
jgi:hypothetical protein